MTSRARTLGTSLGLAALALLLASCVRVDMQLELSPDNTVSGSAVLAVDDSLLELTGQTADELFQDVDTTQDLPEGASVEPYEEDGFVGQRISFEDVPLSEFSRSSALGTGPNEELSITRRGDEFHVDGTLDMTGSEFGGGGVPAQVLESIEFRIAITFPGSVRSATGEVDGNTVTWEPRVGQRTPIRAVASATPSGPPWALILLIVAGVIVLAAVAFLLSSRRRTPAAAPWSDAPAPGAAPAGPVSTPAPAARDDTMPAAAPAEAPTAGAPTETPPAEAPTDAEAAEAPTDTPPAEAPSGAVVPEPTETEDRPDDDGSPPPVPPVSG